MSGIGPRASCSPLAVLGGEAVCTGSWPRWPQIGTDTLERVRGVLSSGRWTVSGPWVGRLPLDVEFAERFSAFVGTRWCVPVDHGSSALLAALIALGVQPGDEVIVPGLTWVACASAVLRTGAIAILVDIDPHTLCLDYRAAEAAITSRTTAILVVHLYSAMAEMHELRRIAAKHRLPIIEDAAQAHGASWEQDGAGSLGEVGIFSMHQNKVLSSGEGGAAVTSDPGLQAKLEQLRGDGRRYLARDERRVVGRIDLKEVGTLQGWNMHMSEMQAALLLDGLERLPSQNSRRARAARFLDREFSAIEGFEIVRPYPQNTARTYYHYVLPVDPEMFARLPIEVICEAVSAELRAWVYPPIKPLNAHPLYQPQRHPFARLPGWMDRLNPRRFDLPEAHRLARSALLFHHSLLLGTDQQLLAIVEAVDKVRRHAHRLTA